LTGKKISFMFPPKYLLYYPFQNIF